MHMINSKITSYALKIIVDILNSMIEDVRTQHIWNNKFVCELYNMTREDRIYTIANLNLLYFSKIESSIDYNNVSNLIETYKETYSIYRYILFKRTPIMMILHYTLAKQLYPKSNIKILYDRVNNHAFLLINNIKYDIFDMVGINIRHSKPYEVYSNLYSFCKNTGINELKRVLKLSIALNTKCNFLLNL